MPRKEPNSSEVIEGDRKWFGYNYSVAPDKLEPGFASEAINARCRSGKYESAEGHREVVWFRPQFYPYHDVARTGLEGSLNSTTVTATTGTFVAGDVGKFLRFDTGRVLKVTIYTDSTHVEVIDEAFNSADATGAFSVVNDNLFFDSRIADASEETLRAGLFSDPNGYEYSIVVTGANVWFGKDSEEPFAVSHGHSGSIDSTTEGIHVLQAFDQLFITFGEDLDPKVYNTTTGAFNGITATTLPGYESFPRTKHKPLFFQNRVWVCVDRDTILVSDIASYTDFNYLDNEFRLNEGSSDEFVCFHPFGKYSVIVFFKRSIYLLDNVYGDLSEMRARKISRSIGCGSAYSVCDVAGDVYFADLSGNIWSLSQVDETRMELGGQPVSWPVKTHWEAHGINSISKSRAAYFDGYFYFAFCGTAGLYDNNISDYPNYIAVYDTILGQWVSLDMRRSVDYGLKLNCSDFITTTVAGVPSLVYFNPEYQDFFQVNSGAYADYMGTVPDEELGTDRPVYFEIVTRGYTGQQVTAERLKSVTVQYATLHPQFNLSVRYDDAFHEESLVLGQTHNNRTRYLLYGKEDWDGSAATYYSAGREDYLLFLSETSFGFPVSTPINVPQRWILTEPIRDRGNFVQIRIQNTIYGPSHTDVSYFAVEAVAVSSISRKRQHRLAF